MWHWKGVRTGTIGQIDDQYVDRPDVEAKHTYKDGVRTVEIARKLVTGSEFDVQFSDLKKDYAFGVAVFDNAQVRHACSPGVLKMTFA